MIEQKTPTMSMKTLGVNDAPAGGNVTHLEYLSNKSKVWINRMKNGHLPSHIAWMAYKLQLWASLRYGIGTMTNDIEEAEELFKEQEQGLLNILGIDSEQEDIEKVIQDECEVRFTLAHSAPIMTTLLGERLRYLEDEEVARQIITGTFEIPDDIDPATTKILEEIGRMGMKIVNEEGSEIEISPEEFKQFVKRIK